MKLSLVNHYPNNFFADTLQVKLQRKYDLRPRPPPTRQLVNPPVRKSPTKNYKEMNIDAAIFSKTRHLSKDKTKKAKNPLPKEVNNPLPKKINDDQKEPDQFATSFKFDNELCKIKIHAPDKIR